MGKRCMAGAAICIICFFFSVPSAGALGNSPHTIGAGLRFGPFSFIGLDLSYQFQVSETLYAVAYGGYVADLEINLGGGSSSDSYHAAETGIGVKYYLLQEFIRPYGIARAAASIPLVDDRNFLMYATAGAGTELHFGPLSGGLELGIVLYNTDPGSTNEMTWGPFKAYVGPTFCITL